MSGVLSVPAGGANPVLVRLPGGERPGAGVAVRRHGCLRADRGPRVEPSVRPPEPSRANCSVPEGYLEDHQ